MNTNTIHGSSRIVPAWAAVEMFDTRNSTHLQHDTAGARWVARY
jgi:hypothetical protein